MIEREEVEAVRKLKRGKAGGRDGITTEMLKEGGEEGILWMMRIFQVCMRYEAVPMDWKVACVVPIYKGKGDKSECGNYRGISLLSVVGKVYGSVLIEKVKRITEEKIGEEQGGFR